MDFWAKTTAEGRPGISVYEHLMNVGCVARCLTEIFPQLLERFQLKASEVGALAALHDLGKMAPGFQRKCVAWLEENDLLKIDRNGCWDTSTEANHGVVSHSAIQDFLVSLGLPNASAKYVAAILGSHHGVISHRPNSRGIKSSIGLTTESQSGINWEEERSKTAKAVWDYFQADILQINLTEDSPALWWLAGLTSVADWIGSDERFFPTEQGNQCFDVAACARDALVNIGLETVPFIPDLSFHDLFHDRNKPETRWLPNEMQSKAVAAIDGPGIYVIEAPMGMGKTEAALWAAYQLLLQKKANGIYFALPTQVTSNRIHQRVNDFLQRITPRFACSRLIHGNSWLMRTGEQLLPVIAENKIDPDNARAGRDWFASPKRALIAPFGVGTVDQALLGVVAAKHFFVRHFALAGKVVILDEVHSYDLYTGTLLDKLITTLEGLGCTVIILSATLTGQRRDKINPLPDASQEESDLPYPLISGRNETGVISPVAAATPESKPVTVDFMPVETAVSEAVSLARHGGAVLWICNTVDAAQKQYQEFIDLAAGEFPLGLLHSRFPFQRREQLENEWMDRFGKAGENRCGSILVSTQVVEQSVDLDADLLITELAPTDMLLQRLGRLWRHNRPRRPAENARVCIIEESNPLDELRTMGAKEIENALGKKARVYAPFVLLRSLEVWKEAQPTVLIPAQIRELIESTYQEREEESPAWDELYCDWFGSDAAKRMGAIRNSNLWQIALEDREGVQTRLNEMPTISLVLCRSITTTQVVFIDGSVGAWDTEEYHFRTAQAIHKNLVRVPEYCFSTVTACEDFAEYLYGSQSIGIVSADGEVDVVGLKDGIRLFYSDELGLVINK